MWVLSVNSIYRSLSWYPRCGGLGLLNMLFPLTCSRMLLFIKICYNKCMKQSKWESLPSPLKQTYPWRERKAGETAVTVLTLQCKSAGHREQLKQGSSKGGCWCSRSMGVSAWWEEFWPRRTKSPQGLVFQPSSSARSNISCTIVPSVARPKPRSSSAAEIRIESKFSSWGQGESVI